MSFALRGCLAVFALSTAGCAADLALGGGADALHGNPVGIGRASVSTRVGSPMNESGVLVGASFQSRAEANVGARFTSGVMLGVGSGPSAIGGSWIGGEIYGELGTRLGDKIFGRSDVFTGVSIALPMRLSNAREITNLNDSTQLVIRRFELVPLLQARATIDDAELLGVDFRSIDVVGGFGLRMRTFTDLF